MALGSRNSGQTVRRGQSGWFSVGPGRAATRSLGAMGSRVTAFATLPSTAARAGSMAGTMTRHRGACLRQERPGEYVDHPGAESTEHM
jgi:hypothetical protein